MNDYKELVNAWKKLWNTYCYQDMPFFRVIMHYFYKNNNNEYITADEMKPLILHYKNALNEYKKNLMELFSTDRFQFGKHNILRKKIQSEYENLLLLYDDLLNIEDMKNGRIKNTTRKTTKTNR